MKYWVLLFGPLWGWSSLSLGANHLGPFLLYNPLDSTSPGWCAHELLFPGGKPRHSEAGAGHIHAALTQNRPGLFLPRDRAQMAIYENENAERFVVVSLQVEKETMETVGHDGYSLFIPIHIPTDDKKIAQMVYAVRINGMVQWVRWQGGLQMLYPSGWSNLPSGVVIMGTTHRGVGFEGYLAFTQFFHAFWQNHRVAGIAQTNDLIHSPGGRRLRLVKEISSQLTE